MELKPHLSAYAHIYEVYTYLHPHKVHTRSRYSHCRIHPVTGYAACLLLILKNEAFVSDLLFFNLFCISVSNRGQPNLAPDQSEYEYEVFCLEEQNMYSIIYSCAVLLLNAK